MLLNRSMSDLGDTFQRNRALTAQDKEREAQQRLNQEMMGLRRSEAADNRDFRNREADARDTANASMDDYRQRMLDAKDEDSKMQVWSEMLKSGAVTPESLDAMSAAMSKKLGVKVTLAMPAPADNTPKTWTHPETGQAFVYNPRTGNFEKSENPNTVTMTEEEGEDGAPPKRKVTRKMTPADLDAAMKAEQAAKAAADEEARAADGPTPQQQGEIEEILSRPGIPAGGRVPRKTGIEGAPAAVQPGGNVIAPEVFATEESARAAGKKAGDVIKLNINGEVKRVRLK